MNDPERDDAPHKKSGLNKEVNITLNLGILLKTVLVILAVGLVFMGGRLSVSWGDDSPSGAAVADVEEVELIEEVIEEPVEEVALAEPEEVVEEEPEPEPAPAQEITTDYGNVELKLDDVLVDWDEERGFGKVTDIAFTLTNGAPGIIQPSYFVLTMDKYSDPPKQSKFYVASSLRNIPEGEIKKATTEVTNGFLYAKATVGKIEATGVTVQLYDSSDNVIDGAAGDFNLAK